MTVITYRKNTSQIAQGMRDPLEAEKIMSFVQSESGLDHVLSVIITFQRISLQ